MRADDMRILERRLAELTMDISAMQADIERADPKLRESYSQRLKEIQHRRRAIQERLAALRLQQAVSWEQKDFAEGVNRVLDRIGRGLDRLSTRKH